MDYNSVCLVLLLILLPYVAYFVIYFFPCLFSLALHIRKLLSHSFMTLLRHSCCCCWRAAAAAVANVAVAVVVSSLWPVNFLSMSHTLFSQLVVSKSDKDTDTHTYAHTHTHSHLRGEHMKIAFEPRGR